MSLLLKLIVVINMIMPILSNILLITVIEFNYSLPNCPQQKCKKIKKINVLSYRNNNL